MIQAAINPETREFLGVIIPKADLTGAQITVFGNAEAWERLKNGEPVERTEVGVLITPSGLESIEVEGVEG